MTIESVVKRTVGISRCTLYIQLWNEFRRLTTETADLTRQEPERLTCQVRQALSDPM